ncbi:unnamed protein product [Moneuplotes crassus]|uniref:Uncharacterized protein n=1 Tax=Euplotes crassus TaxID=5936 RepID=A0AAD2D3T7_EUPCR|nr:unnamed protein product [Moneuplotes crassus]
MELKNGEVTERNYRIVMIGDTFVGKSSLLVRFSDDQYDEDYTSTVGVDFRFRSIQVNDVLVKLQIWDTTGQEKYKSVTDQYFKGAHGVIFVFDLTDRESFLNLYKWVDEIREKVPEKTQFLAIGNKWDMKDEITVTEKDMNRFERRNNKVFEAKADETIENFPLNQDHEPQEEERKEEFSQEPSKAQRPLSLFTTGNNSSTNSFQLKKPKNEGKIQEDEYRYNKDFGPCCPT